jgi:hypothetical protein
MAQINKPSEYFNTVLYTGTGTTQSITGVGFQPDLVWLKGRTSPYYNNLYDIIRGGTKALFSNAENAEATDAGNLQTFISDGFTADGFAGTNGSGESYVAWNWLANGAGVSNSDGSITSTVSVNTTAGFSIVNWTGTSNATIGHGLGQKPSMVITKSKSNSAPWLVWHKGLTVGNEEDKYIILNSVNGQATYGDYWGTGGFTSTVFGVNLDSLNNNLGDMIAYCFAEKKGYSKFGSYTGNGNADGTFVYTGFKPAFVLRKRTDTDADWRIDDSKRDGYNVIPFTLFPNLNNEETTNINYNVDLLSNGFKCRGISGNQNSSGGSYIYMAFAEQPLVGTNGVPATAR